MCGLLKHARGKHARHSRISTHSVTIRHPLHLLAKSRPGPAGAGPTRGVELAAGRVEGLRSSLYNSVPKEFRVMINAHGQPQTGRKTSESTKLNHLLNALDKIHFQNDLLSFNLWLIIIRTCVITLAQSVPATEQQCWPEKELTAQAARASHSLQLPGCHQLLTSSSPVGS